MSPRQTSTETKSYFQRPGRAAKNSTSHPSSTRAAAGAMRLSLIHILVLGDEMLTPDSSRFWPLEGYEPGHGQPSFDKQ